MKVLVTGATGFVGKALVDCLIKEKYELVRVVRNGQENEFSVGEIGPDTCWMEALKGVDIVVHLAAKVHIMKKLNAQDQASYRTVNTLATLNLAKQAAESGVRRFVFLSTIKVNGEESLPGFPFKPEDVPSPKGPYATSKSEAEEGLLEMSKSFRMEVVIIRPPLIYGPGVKANFLTMLQMISRGLPLPVKCIKNKRSLLALDNLTDFICLCINHPKAANQIFLVSDGNDLSISELLFKAGVALGKSPLLIPFPPKILLLILKLIGKNDLATRLLGNLQVDISKSYQLLGWKPPTSVDESLARVMSTVRSCQIT